MRDLDPRTTAVVLIDVQKGLLGLPLAPHTADIVVARAARLARAAAALGGTVVLVRVHFGDDLSAAPKGETDIGLAVPPGGVPSDWAELAPDLAAVTPHLVVTKHNWSAFYGTDLDAHLRRRGVTHVIVGGLVTNFGVESTVRDGWQGNYTMIVAEDAASSFKAEAHRFAIETTLPRCALVRSSEEIIAALEKRAA